MTEQVFALHVATRNNLLTYLENVSPEQLAQIPTGFHNTSGGTSLTAWHNNKYSATSYQDSILLYLKLL